MIEIAFYKGKSKKSIGNMAFTAFIKLWSGFKYSHTELVYKPNNDPDTWQWSSSTGEGVRTANIYFNPENWDFIELPYFNAIDTFEFIEDHQGEAYDWWGIILSQLFDTKLDNRKKWFCSEVVYASLVEGRFFKGANAELNPATVSPKKLMRLLKAYV